MLYSISLVVCCLYNNNAYWFLKFICLELGFYLYIDGMIPIIYFQIIFIG